MKGRIILLLAAITCQSALAQMYQCPVTNKFINTGDSIQSVLSACGKPVSQTTKNVKGQPAVEEWTYIRNAVSHNLSLTLVIKNNIVVSTKLGGARGTEASFFCAGYQTVRTGMSKQTIQDTCGFPTSKRTLKPATKATKKTTLIYRPQTYLPSRVFTFENGTLVSAKDVQ